MTRLALVACLVAGPLCANPIAEIICAPTDQMTERLTRQFGENRSAIGLRSPDEVMEVWTRGAGESLTLVVRYAEGNSCIVAMGEDWQVLVPANSDPA